MEVFDSTELLPKDFESGLTAMKFQSSVQKIEFNGTKFIVAAS